MFHAFWLVFSSFLILHLGWKLIPLEGGRQKQGAADLKTGEMD